MAGAFDDLIPQSQPTGGGVPMSRPAAGAFDDLVPAAPTPEQQRAERLRKIARASMGSSDPGAPTLFGDAFTLGLQKPVAGLATAIGGKVNQLTGKGEPMDFGEGYQAGAGGYQDMLDEASKNSGWGGTAANVGGSLLSGGPARGAVQAGVWPMIKNALGLGAVEGAARNSEDPVSAGKGALEGGLVSGTTAGVIGGGAKMTEQALPSVIRTRRAERLANRGTPPAELKNQSRSLFKQLDDAGIAYDNNQSTQMVDDLTSDLRQNGYDPQGAHKVLADGVISRLESQRGQPLSLETLQQIRSQASSNATNPDPNVRRLAGRIMSNIDGFVTHETPAVAQMPGSDIGPMWQQARQLWRTANVADDIGWRLDKATRRSASTASGTNIDNPIRQNIRSVVDKSTQPGRFNPYSPAELAQMQRVVEGGGTQNLLRSFGNRFGGSGPLAGVQGNVLGSAGGLGALLHGAEPSTALMLGAGASGALAGAGKAARMGADRMSENEADALVRLISTGSLDNPRLVSQAVPTRASLARLMAQQSLGRGSGVYAGGEATR